LLPTTASFGVGLCLGVVFTLRLTCAAFAGNLYAAEELEYPI